MRSSTKINIVLLLLLLLLLLKNFKDHQQKATSKLVFVADNLTKAID